MNKRRLGNTGLLVGEVGMGCEGFLEKTPEEVSAMIDLMEGRGCNCIDLYTPNPEMRTSLGRPRSARPRLVMILNIMGKGFFYELFVNLGKTPFLSEAGRG